MGFAEDLVYEHILRNLRSFRNIRVASLADSLSCLTDADRDELHSREEARGSQATVYRFYQHLRCRQGWVLDLIEALRHNNAGHLADELQHVYDSCRARPSAPSTNSFHSVASDSHPASSSIGAKLPSPGPNPAPSAPSAQQPHPELPSGDQLPRAMSMHLDARAPVQESLHKTLPEQDTPLPGSDFPEGEGDGHGGKSQLLSTQGPPGTPGPGGVALPSAVPLARGRDWLSCLQHPVCVDNGCFGNANHLQRGAPGLGLRPAPPPRASDDATGPEPPGNQPEENVYVSTESPPRMEEMQPPDSVREIRDVPGSEPPGGFVASSSSPLVDAEQKGGRMVPGDGGGGDTQMEGTPPVTTSAPRDPSPSSDSSLKPPVQEEKPPVVEMAKGTPPMPAMDKVLLASVDPLPPVAGSFGGTPGRTAAWKSNLEGDVELSQPGILLSVTGECPEVAGRCPGSQEATAPCSGVSKSLSFSSDPLMVSTDSSEEKTLSRVSSSAPAPAHPREEEASRVSRHSQDSHPPASQDSTTLGTPSLGTHKVCVTQYPSTPLQAANDPQDGADLGNLGSLGPAPSSSEARVAPGDSKGPSLPYMLPALGIALGSAVAFLVYARWRK